VYVHFSANNSTTWNLGVSTNSNCDLVESLQVMRGTLVPASPATSNDCTLVVDNGDGIVDPGDGSVDVGDLAYYGLSSDDFSGITLGGALAGNNVNFFSTGDQVRFNFTRGTATNGTIYLALPGKYEMRVLVSPVGRIKVCTPNTNRKVPGYSVCP
jgi:hypothetical protein